MVTLASPDDAFGGPLRVALNQAAELSRRGDEVHIAAGWGEDASPGSPRGNARQTLFRHSIDSADGLQRDGESGLAWWLLRNIATYDIVHIHSGRI
jgi:hypothetical protein